MAGLLGDDVTYQAPALDPWANQRIDQNITTAQRSPEQYAAEKMNQVPQAAQMAQQSPEQAAASEQTLGMGMNQALYNRYQKQVGEDTQRMSTLSNYEAQLDRAKQLAKAQSFAIARRNIDVMAKERQMQASAANDAARGSVLGSILNLGITAAAAYFAPATGGGSLAAAAAINSGREK